MSSLSSWFDRLVSSVMAVSVLTIVVLLVRQELHKRTPSTSDSLSLPPEEWQLIANTAVRLSPGEGDIIVTEFMDFQCPYCKQLRETTSALKAAFPAVDVRIHHFPLPYHAYALPAAILAECASRQDRFAEMFDLLFLKQDSLGMIEWRALAEEIGLDGALIQECVEMPLDSFPRIHRGVELARSIGATGTPTVLVNGRILRAGPTFGNLKRAIQAELDVRQK